MDKMVIAVTQSRVVHREAFPGSDEGKRIVSLAELFQPFDDGLPYETSIAPTRFGGHDLRLRTKLIACSGPTPRCISGQQRQRTGLLVEQFKSCQQSSNG
ncbi:MAG: hypothetical protein WCK86_21410, partial [Planctomycetia bacterium]